MGRRTEDNDGKQTFRCTEIHKGDGNVRENDPLEDGHVFGDHVSYNNVFLSGA